MTDKKFNEGEIAKQLIELNILVWNEAIETAAKLAETSKGYPSTVSQNILRLKK